MTDDFDDYHRALTDAVVEGPEVDMDRLIWIMTAEFRFALMRYNENMGIEKDGSEYFGIPIMVGEPADGEPFELKIRDPH